MESLSGKSLVHGESHPSVETLQAHESEASGMNGLEVPLVCSSRIPFYGCEQWVPNFPVWNDYIPTSSKASEPPHYTLPCALDNNRKWKINQVLATKVILSSSNQNHFYPINGSSIYTYMSECICNNNVSIIKRTKYTNKCILFSTTV